MYNKQVPDSWLYTLFDLHIASQIKAKYSVIWKQHTVWLPLVWELSYEVFSYAIFY